MRISLAQCVQGVDCNEGTMQTRAADLIIPTSLNNYIHIFSFAQSLRQPPVTWFPPSNKKLLAVGIGGRAEYISRVSPAVGFLSLCLISLVAFCTQHHLNSLGSQLCNKGIALILLRNHRGWINTEIISFLRLSCVSEEITASCVSSTGSL